MSRVFYARQIQYYKAKISRENRQLSQLQESLNTEQMNKGNKQRLYNMMKAANNYAMSKMLGMNQYSGGLFGLNGMNNNFNNLMNGGMMGVFGGFGNSGSSNIFNNIMNMFGTNGNFMNDMYTAMALNNDYNDLADDNFLSDLKTNDIEQQISMLNSQIQADKEELKNLEQGEKDAIARGASKYA